MKNSKTTTAIAEVVKKNMEVHIAFPECVQIELVQANDVKHYEMFGGFGSLFSTAASGFWVSYITTQPNNVLKVISLIFTVFTLIFYSIAFRYRYKMRGGQVTKVMPVSDLN